MAPLATAMRPRMAASRTVNTAAAVCYAVACLAELGGVWLVVREGMTAHRKLLEWELADNPVNEGKGTWNQVALVNGVVRVLLGARAGIAWAVALLVVGIVMGTVGNYLTL